MSSLEDIVNCYKKYKKVLAGIEEAKEMVKDSEIGEMAKEELKNLEEEKARLDQELEILLNDMELEDTKVKIKGNCNFNVSIQVMSLNIYEVIK